jgi:PAS domain S-box-containing protein
MKKKEPIVDAISLLSNLESGAEESPYSGMLRLMCDNVPDLLWAKDLEKRFLFVNKAICEKLLCAEDTNEPIGKNDMFFARRERERHAGNPGWHTFGEICRDSDTVVMESGKAGRFDEFGNVRGEFLFLDVYKAPFRDREGRIIGTVGCGRVVTDERRMVEALQEREEEYRRIVDEAASVIMKVDLSGRILFMNKFGLNLFGYTMEEIYRRPVVDTILPRIDSTGKEMAPYIREILEDPEKRDYHHTLEEAVGKGGERIYLSWSNRPVFDSQGHCYGYLSIGNDVSDYKIREQDLLQAKEKAEAAQIQKDLFLRTVSHELRTPLSGMITLVEALSEGLGKWSGDEVFREGLRGELELLKDTGETLLSLVEELTLFSRREDELLPDPVYSEFSLSRQLVDPVRRLMEPLARAAGLLFSVEIEPGIPDRLVSDPLKIRQVLLNLLGNAIKYTDSGSVQLKVEQPYPLFPEEENVTLLFKVVDTGTGIPEDIQETIFDFFTRSTLGNQRSRVGSGLGLAISKNIVEALGGGIKLEETCESGSAFSFQLDLPFPGRCLPPGDPSGEKSSWSGNWELQCLKRLAPRLLLADANKLHRLTLAWALKDAGCQVTEAKSREELDRLLEDVKREDVKEDIKKGGQLPELLLLDTSLADPSFLEGAQGGALDGSPDGTASIPLLGLSDWIKPEKQQELLNQGYRDILIKPVSRRLLYRTVAKLLGCQPHS